MVEMAWVSWIYLMSPAITSHHGQNIIGNALYVERGATIFVWSVIANSCASHRVALRRGIPPVIEVLFLCLSCRIIWLMSTLFLFSFKKYNVPKSLLIFSFNFWIFSILQCIRKGKCIYFSLKHQIQDQWKKNCAYVAGRGSALGRVCSQLWSQPQVIWGRGRACHGCGPCHHGMGGSPCTCKLTQWI
jgi:hypothetical protein